MKYPETERKLIYELEISDLFSFSKNGPVHMVNQVLTHHIEYKSYSDGKIRIEYISRVRPVFMREDYGKFFEAKWFKPLN